MGKMCVCVCVCDGMAEESEVIGCGSPGISANLHREENTLLSKHNTTHCSSLISGV